MKKEEQKEAILEKQFDMAMNGSVEMLKWLGIQYCNQDNRPSAPQEELPNGFNVRRIPNEYEQETVQEYEKYRDEFLAWKDKDDNVIDL